MDQAQPEPTIRCSYRELRATAGLIPNPRNPKQHPSRQIELYRKIILTAGWRRPIVVSKRSGMIVKGHGAWMAAKAAGWQQVPVDIQPYATEAEEWADMLADNQLAEAAELDPVQLENLLSELRELGTDMDTTGFDADALRRALADCKLQKDLERGGDFNFDAVFQDYNKPNEQTPEAKKCPTCGQIIRPS